MSSVQAWLDDVRSAEARGDCLGAFDLACKGLLEHPESIWLKHRSVLALARSGATDQAAERFTALALHEREEEDIAALQARIHKDEALRAPSDSRAGMARRAAESYGAIYQRTKGHYPGVNAATMFLLAGDEARARSLAAAIEISPEESPFYRAATRAELALLRGEPGEAARALEEAARHSRGDYAALAATRRQLRLVCGALGLDPTLLAPLAGPVIAHYTGHRISEEGPFRPADEPHVGVRIRDAVAASGARLAFGSLANGADILFAEALLESGAALHAVLPFDVDEFRALSVAPAGDSWLARFEACLAGAASVHMATEGACLRDSSLFAYANRMAMGLGVVRARHLDTRVVQLALWDGRPSTDPGGTGDAIAHWRSLGWPATVLALDGAGPRAAEPTAAGPGRVVRAMLFGDVRGFSKLTEAQLQPFFDCVLGLWARILESYGPHVLHRNTWGDGLYVVLDDVEHAARCAMELQRAMGQLELREFGLPPDLTMRIGAHAGPVFTGFNPVTARPAFFGTHVTRTARVEPATPPGEVFVTDAFAALLALGGSGYRCDYVGEMPAAKGYGRLRMYLLGE